MPTVAQKVDKLVCLWVGSLAGLKAAKMVAEIAVLMDFLKAVR